MVISTLFMLHTYIYCPLVILLTTHSNGWFQSGEARVWCGGRFDEAWWGWRIEGPGREVVGGHGEEGG